MREITKTVSVLMDGKPLDFRLTEADTSSGPWITRLLAEVHGT